MNARSKDFFDSMMSIYDDIAPETFAWHLTQKRYWNKDEDTQQKVFNQLYANNAELCETVKANHIEDLARLAESIFDSSNVMYHSVDCVLAEVEFKFAVEFGKSTNHYIDAWTAGVPAEHIFAL